MVVENVVAAALAFANVPVAGPLTWLHASVSACPDGRPSSDALPSSSTVDVGSGMVLSGPAVTVGGWLTAAGAATVNPSRTTRLWRGTVTDTARGP